MNKKFFSALLTVIILVAMVPLTTFANTNTWLTLEELREQNGAITVEAYNIGQGFLVEPTLYAKDTRCVSEITVDALTDKNIGYLGDIYLGTVTYFSGFQFDDTVEPEYPEYLQPYRDDFDGIGDGNGYLEEFDYNWMAGWCYTINDWWASWGADNAYPGDTIIDYNTGEEVVLGDVIRWHFTVSGYGSDCGFPGNVMAEWMGGNLFIQEDKTDLIFLLAAINDYYGNLATDEVYETALAVAANPLASAEEIALQTAILTDYIEDAFLGSVTAEFEITEYDGQYVSVSFPEEGTDITVIFADYESDGLNKLIPVPLTTAKTNEKNVMSIPVSSDIELSANDKIMLWDGFATCMPLCEVYPVK